PTAETHIRRYQPHWALRQMCRGSIWSRLVSSVDPAATPHHTVCRLAQNGAGELRTATLGVGEGSEGHVALPNETAIAAAYPVAFGFTDSFTDHYLDPDTDDAGALWHVVGATARCRLTFR